MNPSNPEKDEVGVGGADRVRNDGRAAIAVTVLAALLIVFLVIRLV